MVIRVATYGSADHEHGGEDVFGCHSSSTYFQQFHQSIKANVHVTVGVAYRTRQVFPSRYVDGFFHDWFLVCETPHISVHYFVASQLVKLLVMVVIVILYTIISGGE